MMRVWSGESSDGLCMYKVVEVVMAHAQNGGSGGGGCIKLLYVLSGGSGDGVCLE